MREVSATLAMEGIEDILVIFKRELAKDTGITEQRTTDFMLLIEELMAVYRGAFGESCPIRAKVTTTRKTRTFTMRFFGDELDPFRDERAHELRHLLEYGQDVPQWSYEDGWNVVAVTVPRTSSGLDVLKFCYEYAKDDKARLNIGFVVQLVGTAFNIGASFLVARLIVHYTNSAIEQAVLAALLIFACMMLEELTICISEWLYNKVKRHVLKRIQDDLANNVLAIQTVSMNSHGNAVFIRRMTDDAETLSNGLTDYYDLVIQIAGYIGTLVAVCAESFPLFLYEVGMLAVLYLIHTWRSRAMIDSTSKAKVAYERYSGILSEVVQGHHDIRALHFEKRISREIDSRVQVSNDAKKELLRQRWRYRLVSSSVLNVSDLAFMLLVVAFLAAGMLEPAMAVVLYNYHTRLGNKAVFTVMRISDFTSELRLAGDRIRSLLVSREFPKEHFGDKHLEKVSGRVEFKDVSFSYPDHGSPLKSGKRVLEDVSFSVEAGQTVAFAGHSGCGKSTIFNLLNKQYTPDAGAILLDGENVSELDKESVRGSMAVISQYPYLFNATIRENLAYVKPDLTDDEMVRACRACCIHDDIMAMKDGYDTLISEGGRDLSGGQRQRLAIARGLLCDRPILLMDESTSALDNTTQRKVMEALRGLSGNRTVLMIAHRLSTIADADTIFFIDKGKLLASGTHGELMQTCDEYRELYQAEQVEASR
ncbi:MAG: ABC transporter ATP-binding protein [Eggerthellaceae bacterium]|nr:ABC transporter ATP-binding protein [Eggerthellaceae bacterium]